jgi:hypothetical protein
VGSYFIIFPTISSKDHKSPYSQHQKQNITAGKKFRKESPIFLVFQRGKLRLLKGVTYPGFIGSSEATTILSARQMLSLFPTESP